MKKLATIILALAMAFAASSCADLDNLVDKVVDKVVEKLEEFADGVGYIIDNFDQLKNPVGEDGELYEEWMGGGLDAEFVLPETAEFIGAYGEHNDKGEIYCNLVRLPSADDAYKAITYYKEKGYAEYNEHLTYGFLDMLYILGEGKLCMAATKDGVYIEIAYFTSEEGANAVFTIANYDMLYPEGSGSLEGDGSSEDSGSEDSSEDSGSSESEIG